MVGALTLVPAEMAAAWTTPALGRWPPPPCIWCLILGAVLIAVCIGLAAFMQSGDFGTAAMAAGGSLLVATLIGALSHHLDDRMLHGQDERRRRGVYRAAAVPPGQRGTWGLLLAIPIAVIAKVVADHVEGLEVLAEFLGE
ncbi:hypothetical protein ACU4GD_07835 [Cupriavidus basilensis]